jgi:hypothetical protein
MKFAKIPTFCEKIISKLNISPNYCKKRLFLQKCQKMQKHLIHFVRLWQFTKMLFYCSLIQNTVRSESVRWTKLCEVSKCAEHDSVQRVSARSKLIFEYLCEFKKNPDRCNPRISFALKSQTKQSHATVPLKDH